MRLYSYVVRRDSGFAPNPFWGICTLATCKPQIRLRAQQDDWIIGTGSTDTVGVGKLVYAMKVTRPPILFAEYGSGSEFETKIPDPKSENPKCRCGDNIYCRGQGGQLLLRPNDHHYNPEQVKRDLSGKQALVSEYFYYFGRNAVPIPAEFVGIVKRGPGYKVDFPPDLVNGFLAWLENDYAPGVYGLPYEFTGGLERVCDREQHQCVV